MLHTKTLAAVVSGIIAASIMPAHADYAVSFSLPQSSCCSNLVNGLDGFDFTPTKDLTVSALGWYDNGADGLNNPHPVAIYVTSTKELAAPSAIVDSASMLDTTIDFRFTPITPFVLNSGTEYTLVGYGSGPTWDRYVGNPTGGFAFGEDITYERWRTSRSTGLEFPTTAGEVGVVHGVFLGPNFQYSVSSVPELPTYALMLAGLTLLIATKRKIDKLPLYTRL
ncbi:hypothetical protein [Nitrosospira briensis]|uniref:hypothetical protein n=1 Tax=Nitrosospira briensis TaxID=35799 RepID=UPI000468A8A5|nr:hypothetical protein [Nitrosospira briensis]